VIQKSIIHEMVSFNAVKQSSAAMFANAIKTNKCSYCWAPCPVVLQPPLRINYLKPALPHCLYQHLINETRLCKGDNVNQVKPSKAVSLQWRLWWQNECVRISASRWLTTTNTGTGKYPCPDSSSDYSDTPRSRFQRFSPPDVSPLDNSLQVAFTSRWSPTEVSPLGAFTSMSFHLYGLSPVGTFTST